MATDIPYIFVIGFNKTGTRSLHRFFLKNGFPSIHWDKGRLAVRMLENTIRDRKILTGYDHSYKVFSDMMAMNESIDLQSNKYFKILDRDYPDSYFIYNFRDVDKWIQSRISHNSTGQSFVDRSLKIHNTNDPEELMRIWKIERFRFEEDIRRYFCGTEKYLEIDIENDDVPLKISKLIGKDMSGSDWEHIGKTP